MKVLDDGNGAQVECGTCGRHIYIWDGINETAEHATIHYQFYCCKECYDAATIDSDEGMTK